MKKLLLTGITVLITSVISISLFAYLTGEPSYPDSVIRTKIHSDILDEEREVIIHLPRAYDQHKKYPVMYVLDGSSQDKHIANKFDIMSYAGYVPETIIVGLPNVSGSGRQRDYTPPYMRMDIDETQSPMGGGDKFLTFIEEELIPYMAKNYSVSETRSIAGNSRGGLLVLYSLLQKPQLFQGRFCFSPAFWRDDNLIVNKTEEFLKTNDSFESFLYLSLGDKENNKMKEGFTKMAEVLSKKAGAQLIWHASFTKNSDHQSNAEISASSGIRLWSDYLKRQELDGLQNLKSY